MHLRAAWLQQGLFFDRKKIWRSDTLGKIIWNNVTCCIFIIIKTHLAVVAFANHQCYFSKSDNKHDEHKLQKSYVCLIVSSSYKWVMKKLFWHYLFTDKAPPWIGNTALVEFFLLFIESERAVGYFQYKYPSNDTWHTLWWQSILGSQSLCEQKDMAIKYGSNISWLHYHCSVTLKSHRVHIVSMLTAGKRGPTTRRLLHWTRSGNHFTSGHTCCTEASWQYIVL